MNILLIGDEIVDEYIFGSCNKISPEAPVAVVEEEGREEKPGGAANVMANLEALGAQVIFWHGKKKPSIKTRVMSAGQQLLRIDRDNPEEVPPPHDLELNVGWADIIMVADYNQGVVNNHLLQELMHVNEAHKRRLIVDPYRRKYIYGEVDLIKPNRKELESVVNMKVDSYDSLVFAGKKYMEMSAAKNLVVTLGGEGMALFDDKTYFDEPFICQPEEVKEVIDVTGAGDTVFAVLGFIWGHKNFSKSTSVRYAVRAASIAVSRSGCAVVKRGEVFGEEKNNSFHKRLL